MFSKAFKYYLFFIFLIFGLFSPFYIDFVSAYTNYSGLFDANDPAHSQHSSASFDFEYTDSFSFEMWAWFDLPAINNEIMISKVGESPPNHGYSFFGTSIGSDFDLQFQFINTLTSNMLGCKTTPNDNFAYDEWNHFVATYDGTGLCSGVNIYINGSDIALTTIWETISATILTDADFKLGVGQSDTEPFHGQLDEVRIWQDVLNQSDVLDLYNAGDGIFTIPDDLNIGSENLVATFRLDEGSGVLVVDSTNTNHGDLDDITWTTPKVIGEPPPPTIFEFDDTITSVLVGTPFNVSFNATSTAGIIQSCGLWSPFDIDWIWLSGSFGQTCEFDEQVSGVHVGTNEFIAALTIDFETYYSEAFEVVGFLDEDIDPISPSAIPTINFTTANTTTTIGVENIFHIDGYDDVRVLKVEIYDPEINEWVNFQNPDDSDTLEVEYNWIPETAGLFQFGAKVFDNHGQIGRPTSTPPYLLIRVYEDEEGEITIPVISDPILEPDKHFLIEGAQTLVAFLKLPEIWNWFVSLFKEKFPFSWFFSIFDIWGEQRDTILGREAVESLKVQWEFPDVGVFSGQTFALFDLQAARSNYSNFFDIMRIILINIFWLGFAGIVFGKVKKFIGEMSVHD